MKTMYQYTIKTDGESTVLVERGNKLPIVRVYQDAESRPIVAAGLLRDLAKWAIEQAEIIEELEGEKIPERKPFARYEAVLVEV